MYPAVDSSVEYAHRDGLELLVQQQQRPQQLLGLSGEPQASVQLAGPLPLTLRDACRDSEQEIDQEIGALLALKQQLRQRKQLGQQQAQQQGDTRCVAPHVYVDRSPRPCACW
jgi:hypothetical protein